MPSRSQYGGAMNESLDQQAGHSPAAPTGSRQLGQSCGSAPSTSRPKLARSALFSRAKRLAEISVISPCMCATLIPGVAELNAVAALGAQASRAATVVYALRAC